MSDNNSAISIPASTLEVVTPSGETMTFAFAALEITAAELAEMIGEARSRRPASTPPTGT